MLKTRLTEMLGIEYPIIQGAMLWLSRAELAAAVSNAGGLGVIPAHNFATAEEFRQEIQKTRTMTDKPFAVNFTIMPMRRQIIWEEYINAALEEGISIIETSGMSPEPYMEWFKSAKATVIQKVNKVKHAKKAEQLGADAVTVYSFEAGGHIGMADVATIVLIPRAIATVKIPVIAAGGIGTGRGLMAALALGAEGVVMGTRFMASRECPLHPKIKELLVQTQETDTILVERKINNIARVVKTDFSLNLAEMDERGATLKEQFPLVNGERIKRAFYNGDYNDAMIYCGQVAGLIDDVPSVKEIIDSIINEAQLTWQKLKALSFTG